MLDFETYTCKNCNEEFKAHRSANAAAKELCSPRCETEFSS